MTTICRQCKHCLIAELLGVEESFFGEVCNSPEKTTINPVDGATQYAHCAAVNKGNCEFYEEGKPQCEHRYGFLARRGLIRGECRRCGELEPVDHWSMD